LKVCGAVKVHGQQLRHDALEQVGQREQHCAQDDSPQRINNLQLVAVEHVSDATTCAMDDLLQLACSH
jgi:hypothetical protein